MKKPTCKDVRPLLDEYVRRELAPREQDRAGEHLARCRDCRHQAEQARHARSALGVLASHELQGPAIEDRLRLLRASVMAQVRREARERPRLRLRLALSWAMAPALAVLLGFAVLAPPPEPPHPAREGAGPAVAGLAEREIHDLVTLSVPGGVTLRWSGPERGGTYLVLKSRRPASFQDAEVTVVCGTSFTDRSAATGLAFYQVLRADEPCRG